MSWDAELAKEIHQWTNTLILGCLGIIAWFAKGTLTRIEKAIGNHGEKLENHESRISKVEGKLEQ